MTQTDTEPVVTGTHTKQYNEFTIDLLCDGVVMASIDSALGNFQLSPCRRCGKEVQTTGYCPENDCIQTAGLVQC